MSLKGKFAAEFDPRVRDRGVAYSRNGSVEILKHSDSHIEARVKGTRPYLVKLTISQNWFHVACTCPYFDENEECKHLWATILTADSRNLLSHADQGGRLRMVIDEDALEELRLAESSDDESLPQKKPVWKQQLSAVT